jgi:hypothetical protein
MRRGIARVLGIAGFILVVAACTVSNAEQSPVSPTELKAATTAVATASSTSSDAVNTAVPELAGDLESESASSEDATPEKRATATEQVTASSETENSNRSTPDPTATTEHRVSPTSSPSQSPSSPTVVISSEDSVTSDSVVNSMFGPIACRDGEDDIELTHLFYEPDRFNILVPMGRMWDSHVTPTDHLYVFSEEKHEPGMITSPAAGRLMFVESFPRLQSPFWDLSSTAPDLRFAIAHSCTLFSVFIHAGELAPEVAAVVGEIEMGGRWYASSDAFVELDAGDPVAFFAGSNLDYSLHDETQILAGFQKPEHYEGEPWKVHTVDPFDYMSEEIFTALMQKNIRQTAPYGGKIDYDVVGTLAGNWFMDKTIDYAGGGLDRDRYWNGHMSISYDHVDPSEIRVSIGRDIGIKDDCRVCGGVYAVMNNSPDPASVTAADGLMKYELTGRTRLDPNDQERTTSDGVLLGTLATQVIDDETIRVEFVRGAEASSVQGFSSESVLYRR